MDIRNTGNDPVPTWFKAYEAKSPSDPSQEILDDWKNMWDGLQDLVNAAGGSRADGDAAYAKYTYAESKLIDDLNKSGKLTPEIQQVLMSFNNNLANTLNAGVRLGGGWSKQQAQDYFDQQIKEPLMNILDMIQKAFG